jgi:hypothetical protein
VKRLHTPLLENLLNSQTEPATEVNDKSPIIALGTNERTNLVTEKYCKHCEIHHPLTNEHWEFTREGVPFRCKEHRRNTYQEQGKQKAADYWRNLTPEQRATKAARKKALRTDGSIDKMRTKPYIISSETTENDNEKAV